jgi:riboflavin synthase
MFTGIVQAKASVISFVGDDSFRTLTLSVACEHLDSLNIGASISINGVCLTVTQFESHVNDVVGQVQFDVIDETLEKSNLKYLKRGDKVNFERSVTFGTELGGHIVSGHVHDIARIVELVKTEENCRITLDVSPEWMKYILHKGFVSVNGCSLTVGDVSDSGFNLHLIPETLNITNLGLANIDDELNIEVDQQTYSTVQAVERYLKNNKVRG